MSVRAQSVLDVHDDVAPPAPPVTVHSRRRRRGGVALAVAVAAGVLFTAYLRMARSTQVNADGSANARQAWDLLHGNLLLHNWTVSDVSFYTTELPQYAVVELCVGLRPGVVHLAAAMTYTLLVLLVAAVSVGRATGREAVVRAGIALAVVVVPAHSNYLIALNDPDHTGTAVPLLLTWLVLDRVRDDRRLSWLVAVMLTWAQIGDPLALFVGTLPLVVVSTVRLYRQRDRNPHPWGGADAALLVGGAGSILLSQLVLATLHAAGGFTVHPPIAQLSPFDQLGAHVQIAFYAMTGNFGARPDEQPGLLGAFAGGVHLVALALVLVAIGLGVQGVLARRAGRGGDRVADVLTVGVTVNLVAFVVSTQAGDGGTARQIITVLPFGAVLAARLVGPLVSRIRLVPATVVVLLAVLCVPLVSQAADAHAVPAEGTQISAWLRGQGLSYGIGSYWASHNVTVATRGRVEVAPTTGDNPIMAYRWESRTDWYDPALHDARFVIVPLRSPADRTLTAPRAQFGEPVETQYFRDYAVLVYDHNLLVGLPAECVPGVRPSITDCPPTGPVLPGTS